MGFVRGRTSCVLFFLLFFAWAYILQKRIWCQQDYPRLLVRCACFMLFSYMYVFFNAWLYCFCFTAQQHVCKRALLTRLLSKFLVGGTCALCWRVLRIRAYIHAYSVRITHMCYVQMHRFTGRLNVVARGDLGFSFCYLFSFFTQFFECLQN